MMQPSANQGTKPRWPDVGPAEPMEIRKARDFIHEYSDELLSLAAVSQAARISPNHLSEKFKQVIGVNFVDYVARLRFEKACGLLHHADLRISEIAFAVGFQSLSQFNRVFKKLAGASPTQYRGALFGGNGTAGGRANSGEVHRRNA